MDFEVSYSLDDEQQFWDGTTPVKVKTDSAENH
jgi:hypothetical protein